MTTGRLAALLLALTFAAAPVGAFSSLAGDHPKVLRAAAIFDEIVAAIGDGRTAPALRLIPAGEGGDLRVLWYDGERHVIILEESAFDVLMADADSADALAFVLGHELAHYYKDHRWTADFSHQIRDLSLGRTLQGIGNSRRKRTEIEAEADYFGGFYAHMAGYDALGAAPDALRRIYDHFELTQVASDYPSLADRQGLVHQARQGLAQLIPVFEAGVRLLLLG
ncbi:MAG: M48 family metalloprotease, partial [Gemmatimonadetes bacterium]|nr:M48 family metalloprotease [Gemmatimonadota bacterium]